MEGDPNKRSITHYQYIHWPDFGSPPTKSLVKLVRQVGASKPDKPMVLHCSAGLGRSGVFASVHAALECHVDKRHVDVHRVVATQRQQREGMVQTQQQYRACYETIAEACLPAEMDNELTQQPDSRPLSYPPPPYQEREETRKEGSPPPLPTSAPPTLSEPSTPEHRGPSPPPPPTSPPPPLSEPSTPVKAAIPVTPPTDQYDADTVEKKKRLSELSSTPPSRPVSVGEQEVKTGAKQDSPQRNVAVEVELVQDRTVEPKKVEPKKAEPKKAETKKMEPEKTRQSKAEPKKVEPKKSAVQPKKTEPKKVEPKKDKKALGSPEVMVTAPSTEQLNTTVLVTEGTPPPLPVDEPPPEPSSPPPSEGKEEEADEEEGGFSIGDDQVIVEKPYEKGDEKKHIPSNQPKWSHQPSKKKPPGSVNVPSWNMRQQQQKSEEKAPGPSAPLPTWRIRQQQRAEEARRAEEAKKAPEKVTVAPPPGKIEVPQFSSSREPHSPKRVGKLNIPAVFAGSGASPEPKPSPTKVSPLGGRSRDQGSQRVVNVELGKSSGSQPTPPSSPAPAKKKWTPTPPSKQQEEEEGEENTSPAIKRLKQLQHKPHLSSLASAPVYKLPVATKSPSHFKSPSAKSPSHSTSPPSEAESESKPSSSSSSHIADTGTGNVARLLARFQ